MFHLAPLRLSYSMSLYPQRNIFAKNLVSFTGQTDIFTSILSSSVSGDLPTAPRSTAIPAPRPFSTLRRSWVINSAEESDNSAQHSSGIIIMARRNWSRWRPRWRRSVYTTSLTAKFPLDSMVSHTSCSNPMLTDRVRDRRWKIKRLYNVFYLVRNYVNGSHVTAAEKFSDHKHKRRSACYKPRLMQICFSLRCLCICLLLCGLKNVQ